MAAPTLIQYAETSWTTPDTAKTTGSITWLAGDVIVAVAGDESQRTIPTPTFAGGTFVAITGAACTNASNCAANAWSCTPVSGGSGAVSIALTPDIDGLGVWVWRNSGGIGNVGSSTSTANNNLTQSLIRSGNNSCVVGGCFDWSATATTGYGWTPTVANDRQHGQVSGQYSYYVADWGDQGSAGTTSYGLTGITAGPFARLFVEILGKAAAAVSKAGSPVKAKLPWQHDLTLEPPGLIYVN